MLIINKNKVDKIMLFFFVITFFSRDFFFNFYFKNIYIDVFSYIFFFLIFHIYINFNIQKWEKIFFYFLIFLGLQIIIKLFNNFSILPLLKQLIPIVIIYISTYYFIKKNSLKIIFDYYIKILFIVCIFGLIQIVLDNFLSITFYQKLPGRIDSIFNEPSHFALLVLPGLTYAILNIKNYIFSALVFAVNLIFTFSIAGYLSFFIVLLIIIFTKKIRRFTYIFILIFISLLSSILYFSYDTIKEKNFGFISSLFNKQINLKIPLNNLDYNNKINDLGLYSVSSNLVPAINMMTINPLGAGLGGHEEVYYNYVEKYQLYGSYYESEIMKLKKNGFNAKSAHSLLIRLLSEFGVFFIIIILLILITFLKNLKKYTNDQINIMIACLSYIIFRCMKLGSYFDYGIYFFIVTILIIIFSFNESAKINITTN